MDKKIQRELDWLKKEIKKDELEIETHKNRLINQIKKIDRTKMFIPEPETKKKKMSLFNKLLIIFGYGKKG